MTSFSRSIMKFALFAVVLAFCAVGAYSSILNNEQRELLRVVRNECAARSGLGPFEIGALIRAIRPTEKVVSTTQCVLQTLIRDQPDFNHELVAREILEHIKVIFERGILPKTITQLLGVCEEAVGPTYCQRIVNLAELLIALGQQNGLVV